MRKILHIPNYYPPHIGGIEEVCYSIVSSFPEYKHTVLCFNDGKETQKDFYEGIEVIRCGVMKKIFSQPISFSYLSEMKKILRDFAPDIIHFHAPNPLASVYLLLLLSPKIRLIIHWHGDIVAQSLLHFFYQLFEKKMLGFAERILVTSPTYISGSKPLFRWKNKIQVIPNTVNIVKLMKKEGDDEMIETLRKRYANKKIVFTFGRHVPYKGLEYLIHSAHHVNKDAIILIAGQGPLTEKLKSISVSTSIQFLGRLTDDTLRQYLYAADVFAFPSITRNEAFGIALAEAMYCGLPAVTFTIANSGVNWVCVKDETGLEVDNRDSNALAEAINKLLDNSSLRESLGTNAAKRVNSLFRVESIREDLVRLYEHDL